MKKIYSPSFATVERSETKSIIADLLGCVEDDLQGETCLPRRAWKDGEGAHAICVHDEHICIVYPFLPTAEEFWLNRPNYVFAWLNGASDADDYKRVKDACGWASLITWSNNRLSMFDPWMDQVVPKAVLGIRKTTSKSTQVLNAAACSVLDEFSNVLSKKYLQVEASVFSVYRNKVSLDLVQTFPEFHGVQDLKTQDYRDAVAEIAEQTLSDVVLDALEQPLFD